MSYLSLSSLISILSVTAEPMILPLKPGCTLLSFMCTFTEDVDSLRLFGALSTSFLGILSNLIWKVSPCCHPMIGIF